MMDHLTRFAVLAGVSDIAAETVAYRIIEHAINIFGPPETLYLDQGVESINEVLD